MGTDEPSVFEIKADYEETKLQEYEREFDRWVGGPTKILWDDYRGRFGIILLTIYLLMGTIGTVVWPSTSPNAAPRMLSPFESLRYPLGTDGMGQDLAAMMIHATPAMLQMILAGAIFANLLGVSVGLFSGYIGGTTDKVIMTLTDTTMSIPGIPLLIILAAILEPTNPYLIGIILSIQSWAGTARVLRSQVIPIANEEHVEAARAYGQPTSSLLVKDILPHLMPYIFIGFLGGATAIVFASVALYFLGILPFDQQNWGVVLNMAYQEGGAMYSLQAAHWIVVPLVTVIGLTVGFTLLAQAFDQVFNPRVRARHRKRKQDSDEMVDEDASMGAEKAESQMGTL